MNSTVNLLKDTDSPEGILIACYSLLSDEISTLTQKEILYVQFKAMQAAADIGLNDEALQFAESYFSNLPYKKIPDIGAVNLYTSLLFRRGEYIEAEQLIKKWKEFLLQDESQEEKCNFINSEASCFVIRKDYKQAATLMQQAKEIADKSELIELSIRISTNLGSVFSFQKKFEEAFALMEKTYQNSLVLNNFEVSSRALIVLISSLIGLNKFQEAQEKAENVLKAATLPTEKNLRISISLQLAKIHRLKNDLPTSITILEKSLQELDKEVIWQLVEPLHKVLINLYKETGKFKKAFLLLEAFKEKSDKILQIHAEKQLKATKKLLATTAKVNEAKLLGKKNTELKKVNTSLQEAHAKIESLAGIIPVCSYCKNIRDDEGLWKSLENYLAEHSDALLSHSVCPECYNKHSNDSIK